MTTNLKVYIGNIIALAFSLSDIQIIVGIILATLTSIYTIFKIVESWDKRKWYKNHEPKRKKK